MNDKYPLALPEGSILAGQYIIQKVLGQGGFGITYMALDHKSGQKLAIKEFFPDTLASRTGSTVNSYPGERTDSFQYGKSCFLQEAETLAAFIGSENIVKIHSYFEENGTAYFVMDFVEGISFEEYIRQKGGKISYDEAESVLIHIIDALALVHSRGIVHRDVTPDNIYITNDGTVKLLDFGAARYSLGDKSRSLDVVLKHGFAPKEQYTRHGRQGPFTDVYTVGASFYFAITGKRPPDSIDRLEEDDLIPPSSLGVKISREKEDAILKALSVQPGDRFQTMGEFKSALLAAGGMYQGQEGQTIVPLAGSAGVTNRRIFTAPQTEQPVPSTVGQTVRQPEQPAVGQAARQPEPSADGQTTRQPVEASSNGGQRKKTFVIAAVIAAAVLVGAAGIAALTNSGKDGSVLVSDSGKEETESYSRESETQTWPAESSFSEEPEETASSEEPEETGGNIDTPETAEQPEQPIDPYEELLGNTSDNLKNRALIEWCYESPVFWLNSGLYDDQGKELLAGVRPCCLNYVSESQMLFYVSQQDGCVYRVDASNLAGDDADEPVRIVSPDDGENIMSFYVTESCVFCSSNFSDGSCLYRWHQNSDAEPDIIRINSCKQVAFQDGYVFYIGTDNCLYRVPTCGEWSSPEYLGAYESNVVVNELCSDADNLYVLYQTPFGGDTNEEGCVDSSGYVHRLDRFDPKTGELIGGVRWTADRDYAYNYSNMVAYNGGFYYVTEITDTSGSKSYYIDFGDMTSITDLDIAGKIGSNITDLGYLSIFGEKGLAFYAYLEDDSHSLFVMDLDSGELLRLDNSFFQN